MYKVNNNNNNKKEREGSDVTEQLKLIFELDDDDLEVSKQIGHLSHV